MRSFDSWSLLLSLGLLAGCSAKSETDTQSKNRVVLPSVQRASSLVRGKGDLLLTTQATPKAYVVEAAKFAGSTAGQKIANALSSLNSALDMLGAPLSGGVVDARGLQGQQLIDVELVLGTAWKKSITLLLGPGTFRVSKTIHIAQNSSIVGALDGSGKTQSLLLASDNASLWAVITFGLFGDHWSGASSALRDLIVDGNRVGRGTMGSEDVGVILIDYSTSVNLVNVEVRNSAAHGILQRYVNTPDITESGQVNMRQVVSSNNAFSGFKNQSSGDNFVYESTFARNERDGIELLTSPTLRIQDSTLSDNRRHGLSIASNNSACTWCGLLIVVNNTFANNASDGINIVGTVSGRIGVEGNLIVSNRFYGGACYSNREAIQMNASRGNLLAANLVNDSTLNPNCPPGGTPQRWENAFRISSSVGPSLITSTDIGGFAQRPSGAPTFAMSPGDDLDPGFNAAFTTPGIRKEIRAPSQPPFSLELYRIDASLEAGETAGKKIAAAINRLNSLLSISATTKEGVIDARSLVGDQLIDVPLQVGIPAVNKIKLYLGRAIYRVTTPILVGAGSAVIGLPTGNIVGGETWTPTTVLKALDSASLWSVVQLGGSKLGDGDGAALHDLVIDGNKALRGTAHSGFSCGLLISNSSKTVLTNVTVKNSAGQGICLRFADNTYGKCPGCGDTTLNRIMAIENDYSGLFLKNIWQTDITQSQFEKNGLHGIEMDSSNVVVMKNSDLGANKKNGIYAYAPASCNWCGWMTIVGNQVGGNLEDGIRTEGTASVGNLIAANSFIGFSQKSAMTIIGGKGNIINANLIEARFGSGINGIAFGNSIGGNWISGNVFDGSGYRYPFVGTAFDSFVKNLKVP